MMSDPLRAWDGNLVRTWLDRRSAASKLDQTAADRRGYEARDDYDNAVAEEWVCKALQGGEWANGQATFAARIKELVGADEYQATGIHDDTRFERHVRGHLRTIAKMTKDNDGFENKFRYR